jgi:hypothetical protein
MQRVTPEVIDDVAREFRLDVVHSLEAEPNGSHRERHRNGVSDPYSSFRGADREILGNKNLAALRAMSADELLEACNRSSEQT